MHIRIHYKTPVFDVGNKDYVRVNREVHIARIPGKLLEKETPKYRWYGILYMKNGWLSQWWKIIPHPYREALEDGS